MTPAMFVICCSLLWLCWRAVQLWSTPLTLVLRHLQIEIPSPPQVTIDALTSDSVSLHWAPPDSYVKKHIIRMDGHEVGVSQRGETSVTILGLTSDYLYSIQVIAVNAQGFQIASRTAYVKTRPKDGLIESCTEEPDAKLAGQQGDASSACMENIKVIQNATKEEALTVRKQPQEQFAPGSDEPPASGAFDTISLKIVSVEKVIAELDQQLVHTAETHSHDEMVISKKLDELKHKKKEDDDARSLRDQHHKQVDQQRRETESRRNQTQKALKIEQDTYRKQTLDIETFESTIETSKQSIESLHETTQITKLKADQAIKEAERSSAIAAEELSEIESEIRYLLQRKAEAEAELAKLRAESRVPTPSPQEVQEVAIADAQWKDREESLLRQLEEAQYKYMRLQNNVHPAMDPALAVTNQDPVIDVSQLGRHLSRRSRNEDHSRSDVGLRSSSLPHFNPDAPPFVASSQLYPRTNSPPVLGRQIPSYSSVDQHHVATMNDSSAFHTSSRLSVGHQLGTSSIFLDDTSQSRNPSPFLHRDSPKSSQSGSVPSSPAVLVRPPVTSIFNSAPAMPQRHSSGSLVATLNGTPINETDESTEASPDNNKRFWPVKKMIADPLALDRKSTRSLPKADVAPIGTKRMRSGSLHESSQGMSNSTTVSQHSPSGYPDLDLLEVFGRKVSREPSVEKDSYATSALPLPRPSSGSAFGWQPYHSLISQPRNMPNLWNVTDSDQPAGQHSAGFDPFIDLPNINIQTTKIVDNDFLSSPTFHTTIDSSRLSLLNRQQSDSSHRSTKSKTESHETSPRGKRLADTRKFSSFVGRVFGKKEDREANDLDGGQKIGELGITL